MMPERFFEECCGGGEIFSVGTQISMKAPKCDGDIST